MWRIGTGLSILGGFVSLLIEATNRSTIVQPKQTSWTQMRQRLDLRPASLLSDQIGCCSLFDEHESASTKPTETYQPKHTALQDCKSDFSIEQEAG